jgi:uncharacterized protein DUF4156/putative oligomerization/nucleic acid binding protein
MLLAIAGCATAPPVQLTSGASSVLVAKSDPGDNYEMLGPVSGVNGEGCGAFGYKGSFERATTKLRNRTYDMGGNYAQIILVTEPHLTGDCYNNQYVIRATAYKKVRNEPSPILIRETSEENLTKKLRELKKLLDDGILSRDEYEKQKTKLLEKGF